MQLVIPADYKLAVPQQNPNLPDGLFFDMHERLYHHDPAPQPSLSSSVVKKCLEQSMRHAWAAHPRLNPKYEHDHKPQYDRGSAAHNFILQDVRPFEIIDAKDYRTDFAKKMRDDAYDGGRIPLLKHQFPEVKEMVDAAKEQIAASGKFTNAFTGGMSEVTLIWEEKVILPGDIEVSVWCRIRIDNCAENELDFFDYKTTGASANPDEIQNYAKQLGWHITSAFYKRGIRKVLGIDSPNYRFIVQENYFPFCLSSMAIGAQSEERAERLIQKVMFRWAWCSHYKIWPGYVSETAWVDLPVYYLKNLEEIAARESTEENPADVLSKRSLNWKLPSTDE